MSDVKTIIADNAKFMETALTARLEAVSAQCGSCPELAEAMKYAVLDGGKRVRPFLCIEFCRLFGGTREDAEPYASAVEFIHSYSLIHDDMPCMDNDMYRRGKLTVHAKFGEAAALLAGDALLTLAFETAVSPRHAGCADAVAVLSKFAGAAGMCGGQAMDLKYTDSDSTPELIAELRDKKTSALLRAAAVTGVIASGGADTEKTAVAEKFATALGYAFQMRDDLLDFIEGGSDEKNGRATALTNSTVEAAEKAIAEQTDIALATVKKYEGSRILTDFAAYLANRKK